MFRHAFLPAVIGAFLGLAAGVSPLPAARAAEAPAAVSVRIDNFTFQPAEITVAAGTTVTFTNADDIPHTVVATGKSFRSPVLDTDGTFSHTFATAGDFAYFCSLHPHMTGVVHVTAP